MLRMIILSNLFILPFVLLVAMSELRRKYRNLKEEAAENPGSVPGNELKKWKWISIAAAIVFWAVIAVLAAIPALFFVALTFM